MLLMVMQRLSSGGAPAEPETVAMDTTSPPAKTTPGQTPDSKEPVPESDKKMDEAETEEDDENAVNEG